jgi:hypothetical protein
MLRSTEGGTRASSSEPYAREKDLASFFGSMKPIISTSVTVVREFLQTKKHIAVLERKHQR